MHGNSLSACALPVMRNSEPGNNAVMSAVGLN